MSTISETLKQPLNYEFYIKVKNIYFTPGPSQVYPTFNKHMHEALDENISSTSHRSSTFMDLFTATRKNLTELLGIPKQHKIYFLSSATECMERILQNCVKKYSLHFVNGAFSSLFYKTAVSLNKKAGLESVQLGESFDFSKFKLPKKTELVCFTHNETSSGVSLNLNNIKKQLPKNGDMLFSLDIVSSAPYVKVDFSLYDLVFFSVQKGFGLPPGLGVLIVSPKAFEKATYLYNKSKSIRSFHDFINLEKYAQLNQTPETPNVLLIYLFNEIVKDLIGYGIEKIRNETEIKSKLIYEYFGRSDYLSPFVKNVRARSKTVCVANTFGNSDLVVTGLKRYGLIIGSGYKDMKASQVRIANFPAHDLKDFEKLVESLELVCNKFKISEWKRIFQTGQE